MTEKGLLSRLDDLIQFERADYLWDVLKTMPGDQAKREVERITGLKAFPTKSVLKKLVPRHGEYQSGFAEVARKWRPRNVIKFRPEAKLSSNLDDLIEFRAVKWEDNPLYPEDVKSTVQKVPISKIISHQNAVKRHIVNEYKKKPGRDLPMLHKMGNKYVVEDGNHRIVAKKEKGEKTVRARVFTKEKELSSKLDDLIEFAISIGTAKKVFRSVRSEYPGLTTERDPGDQSSYMPGEHTVMVGRKIPPPMKKITGVSPLMIGMHEHGHVSLPKKHHEYLKGAGWLFPDPEKVVPEEYRANRDIFRRVKKYGTPAEAKEWERFAQSQIKHAYRGSVFNEGMGMAKRFMKGVIPKKEQPGFITIGRKIIESAPYIRRQKLSAKLDELIEFKAKLHQPGREDEPPGTLPVFEPGTVLDYNVQRHHARRAGLHRDVRIGGSRHGLASWATRKDLPAPGESIAIHQQPTHPHSYLGWSGTIPSGYGAGDVRSEELRKALVTKSSEEGLHATLSGERGSHRVAFVKTKHGWLFSKAKAPQPPKEAQKPPAKSLSPEEAKGYLKNLPEGSSVQPKVDGSLIYVTTKGGRPEVFSHRVSKTTGEHPIHTERIFRGRPTVDIPREHQRTLVGELYGTSPKGETIPPQQLGGILNAHIDESIAKQDRAGVKLKVMPFDYVDGQDEEYAKRLEKVRQTVKHLPADVFQPPEEAKTPEAALRLYEKIRSGRHPLTKEGVIVHEPHGKMKKVKFVEEANVKIHSTFPGTGKFEGSHGGFYYAGKHGERLGKVGTGFSDETRRELHKYIGRTARVRYQEKFPSGKLRAPSFIAVDEGK